MTAKQLKAAREAHWRQDRRPILTLEEAESWFLQHPLTLFLPRPAQLPVPAPSFAEACLGEASAAPPPAAIEQAAGFLARLTLSGRVIALNLFGATSEQPDFLVHAEALPFVLSLRGERNWKQGPASSGSHTASPLVVELWKLLEQAGQLTAAAARERLGRELTEAAVLRALNALWQPLRAIPVLEPAGRPVLWELLQTHHRQALAAGSSTSQVTAISLLVSMYLQSVYAATGEEIETFLSPLVSRSRIREAVRGLSATKQIHSLSMDAQTYYFLEDGLPEFAPAAEPQWIEPARRQRSHPTGDREGVVLPTPSRAPGAAPPSRTTSPRPAAASRPGLSPGAKKWKDPRRTYTAGKQSSQNMRRPGGSKNRQGAAASDSSQRPRKFSVKREPQDISSRPGLPAGARQRTGGGGATHKPGGGAPSRWKTASRRPPNAPPGSGSSGKAREAREGQNTGPGRNRKPAGNRPGRAGKPAPGGGMASRGSTKLPGFKPSGFKSRGSKAGASKKWGSGPRSSRPQPARPGKNRQGGKGNFRSRESGKKPEA